MSNKNRATVLVYRPRGGNLDPSTRELTPYYDIYNQCEVVSFSYSCYNPYITFHTKDSQGKATKITAVGMPFTIVEDVPPSESE